MATGYLAVWFLFSVLAVDLRRALADALLLSPMMEASSPTIGAAPPLVAGVYQWTPLKQACLRVAVRRHGSRGS